MTIDMDLSGTVTAGDVTRSTRYDVRGRVIEERHTGPISAGDYGTLYSRHALRGKSPLHGVRDVYGKARALFVHRTRI